MIHPNLHLRQVVYGTCGLRWRDLVWNRRDSKSDRGRDQDANRRGGSVHVAREVCKTIGSRFLLSQQKNASDPEQVSHARQRHGGRWGNRSAADGHAVRWCSHSSREDVHVCFGMAAPLHHRGVSGRSVIIGVPKLFKFLVRVSSDDWNSVRSAA
jgi:prepilin-type processing-associated H-X9-DG protein